MPDAFAGGSLAVVGLGLLASAGWGISDFGGGIASRRAPTLGVLLVSQAVGLLFVVPLASLRGEPAMTPRDLAIAIAVGTCGAVGLASLYRGLSTGRMGIVAPVAGVLTAVIPVAFGLLTEGLPPVAALIGIGLAIASVVLVSRVPAEPGEHRGTGLLEAILAGSMFGLFAVGISQLSEGLLFTPLVVTRTVAVTSVALAIAVLRRPWRIARPSWPIVAGIGLFDTFATFAYVAAIVIGPLAVAAILSSLYPVMTVVLAATVLRERVTAAHALGIAAAMVAIVLIAGGTA